MFARNEDGEDDDDDADGLDFAAVGPFECN
jgi:hypothetical protein